MKTIKYILRQCETDAQLIVVLIGLFCGYVFIFGVFYNFHWLCGMMSPYVTTSLLSAGVKICRVIDKMADEEKESKKAKK